jgi:hypothetical protein
MGNAVLPGSNGLQSSINHKLTETHYISLFHRPAAPNTISSSSKKAKVDQKRLFKG